MAVKFSNCEVIIDNRRILAQNATINQSNSLSPLKVIGYRNVLNNTPTDGVKNSIKIDYTPETENEPNHRISYMMTSYDYPSPVEIKVAGHTVTGYLNNYSLSLEENTPVKASVEFSIFHELTDGLTEQSSTGYLGYNQSNSLTVGHYWASQISNSDYTVNGDVISLDYNFRANWQPIYKIGSPIPSQVTLLGSQETFNFTSEYESNITYSGRAVQDSLANCSILRINNLSYDWTTTGWFPLSFSLADGKIISHTINLSENNIVTTQTEVVKYH